MLTKYKQNLKSELLEKRRLFDFPEQGANIAAEIVSTENEIYGKKDIDAKADVLINNVKSKLKIDDTDQQYKPLLDEAKRRFEVAIQNVKKREEIRNNLSKVELKISEEGNIDKVNKDLESQNAEISKLPGALQNELKTLLTEKILALKNSVFEFYKSLAGGNLKFSAENAHQALAKMSFLQQKITSGDYKIMPGDQKAELSILYKGAVDNILKALTEIYDQLSDEIKASLERYGFAVANMERAEKSGDFLHKEGAKQYMSMVAAEQEALSYQLLCKKHNISVKSEAMDTAQAEVDKKTGNYLAVAEKFRTAAEEYKKALSDKNIETNEKETAKPADKEPSSVTDSSAAPTPETDKTPAMDGQSVAPESSNSVDSKVLSSGLEDALSGAVHHGSVYDSPEKKAGYIKDYVNGALANNTVLKAQAEKLQPGQSIEFEYKPKTEAGESWQYKTVLTRNSDGGFTMRTERLNVNASNPAYSRLADSPFIYPFGSKSMLENDKKETSPEKAKEGTDNSSATDMAAASSPEADKIEAPFDQKSLTKGLESVLDGAVHHGKSNDSKEDKAKYVQDYFGGALKNDPMIKAEAEKMLPGQSMEIEYKPESQKAKESGEIYEYKAVLKRNNDGTFSVNVDRKDITKEKGTFTPISDSADLKTSGAGGSSGDDYRASTDMTDTYHP